ncbi:DUF3048 domain-containing protein [Yonghaparkia sp. Soil809]|uniref:DUF3048 domain-containing protein n=1 Tax=Yonghaparkia sp. Soil809 TaxID=1736417 RepID=UPI000701E78C|nr:DUF3048 domain-containing protein [Yonghaparkia sp. Soil809]KRF32986.1 hypothetical protein ASG83_02965 [Yonghaparkia sp. Soil809]
MDRPARRRSTAVIALGAAAALLVGCTGAAEPDPVSTSAAPEATPEPAFTSTYVAPEDFDLAPLTGERIAVGGLAAPSLAAKIDNHPRARPQIGIDRADIVFEELVEGGLTRYVAVWHSDIPAEIGPIRSIRPMDPDIISPLRGIVAYSGGQQRFVDMMRATDVYNAIHGQADTDAVMYRGGGAPAPHNVIVRAPQLIAQHSELAPPQQHFGYAADAASATAAREGAPASSAALVFGSLATPSWAWDAGSATWLRTMTGGAPDVAAGGARLSAVNLVIVRVPVDVIQDIPTTQMIGSGEAWVLQAGKALKATWSKADRSSPVRLVDANGLAVRLAPGNTWVELVPNAGSVAIG